MKKIILTALSGLIILLALGGCNTVEAQGAISSEQPLNHDWGDINIAKGLVAHTFELKNESKSEITITGAPTSCMCTTAQYEFAGENYSPKFGLHSNPKNWSYTVAPGEEFELIVTFDPMAHGPNATGPIMRTVSVNGTGNQTLATIKVSGNVLSNQQYNDNHANEEIRMGDFVFTEKEFDFETIKQSDPIASHEFSFTYVGDSPLTITGTPTSCPCTSASIDKKQFNPGDSGIVTVKFDPNLHKEPDGKFFKTINLLTDPKQAEEIELKIWAEVDLDLGPEAFKLKEEHID